MRSLIYTVSQKQETSILLYVKDTSADY